MSAESGLHDKMRALAASGHPQADELCKLANEFEDGIKGFYAEPQTISAKQFLGRWARARRLWCDCTGESLV